jgi:hypothetical protein
MTAPHQGVDAQVVHFSNAQRSPDCVSGHGVRRQENGGDEERLDRDLSGDPILDDDRHGQWDRHDDYSRPDVVQAVERRPRAQNSKRREKSPENRERE